MNYSTVSSQRLKSCAEDKECRKRNSTHNNLWNYFGKNILTGPNFIKLLKERYTFGNYSKQILT
jgi:hypothetical protein